MDPQGSNVTQQIHNEETSQSSSVTSEHSANGLLDAKSNVSPASTAPPNPRLQALLTRKSDLESTLVTLQTQRSELVAQARLSAGNETTADLSEDDRAKAALASANAIVKDHIALLQKYNEIKDIGQGLMGLIAEERNVRIGTVMEEFGMGEKD